MTLGHRASETMDAGLLVRYLHDELDPDAARAVSDHLRTCRGCHVLAGSLGTRMLQASRALQTATFDGPDRDRWREVLNTVRASVASRRRAPRFQVAAAWILAVLGAAVLVAPPAVAWLAELRPGGLGGGSPAALAPTQSSAAARAELRFDPRSREILVVLATTQEAGQLSVRFTDAATAAVSVVRGGNEEFTVGQSLLRIENDPSSRASYRIVLPDGVDEATVRIGGSDPIRLSRHDRGGEPIEISLTTGRLVRSGDVRDEY